MARVLIAEDDGDIASALSRGLAREGYVPVVAHDAAGALAALGEGCDAAIVDVMLGADRGDDLVREMRRAGLDLPIIMLSALSGVEDRARGLAAGADDYIAKPFEFAELVTRLRVQEQRRAASRSARRAGARLTYDPETRGVSGGESGGGRTVSLTEREGDLLVFLMTHREHVLSRGEIFDALWKAEGGSSENVVDVYVGYLRRKLAPMSDFGARIRTIRGKGFMLTETLDD